MRSAHIGFWIAVLAGSLLAGPALAQGRWTSVKPIPQGEEEVYGTAAGGKLYVFGGVGVFPGWEPKRMLWSFDAVTSEWTRLQNLPEGIRIPYSPRCRKLYSIGGFTIARPQRACQPG